MPYSLKIPGSAIEIEMVPIPGGKFLLGSSEDSPGFKEDEAPQVPVEVGPMWVAKYETTWEQYELFMALYERLNLMPSDQRVELDDSNASDAVTMPTPLYDPSFTFKFGQGPKLPAVTMTQYSAKQYTKWLSKLTGGQYRLPTEAEWEYACRSGTATEYSFGDDEGDIDDYAWHADNSDEVPHDVGQKKPNAFGLYDMHGNAMEWVIGAYSDEGYVGIESEETVSFIDAIQWPEFIENRPVRGGSFRDFPDLLRSAARLPSSPEDEWKDKDPNEPLSPWWLTADITRAIGFRVVRSYQPLDDEMLGKFWEIDHEDIQDAVDQRVDGGRGVRAPINGELLKELQSGS